MTISRLVTAIAVCVWLLPTHTVLVSGQAPSPHVTVREIDGTYSVAARFEVPESPAVALAVLSDYEQIPRFMPDVRSSVILNRTPDGLLVEQEAVSQLMMFSKKVHLVLEVTEDAGGIQFVDRCGKSFSRYEGAWRLTGKNGGTVVVYELTAHPAFDVPGFVLKRLLKRDSGEMISRLRREIAARALRRLGRERP
jgi:ribosome-associated toxin RatA of RatAB toxin-antitoxin module